MSKNASINMKIIKDRFHDIPDDEIQKALAIAESYGLDLSLGHAVILKRKDRRRNTFTYNLYITRDGLLHLMHKMGKPWSIDVGEAQLKKNPYTRKDDVWLEGVLTIYNPDVDFTQTIKGGVWLSEYNTGTGSWKTHTASMHFKVVEVFLYRRGANVALTPVEEIDRVLAAEAQSAPAGMSRESRDLVERALKFAGFTKPTVAVAFFSRVVGLERPLKSLDEGTEAQARTFVNAITGDGKEGTLKRLAEWSEKVGIPVPAAIEWKKQQQAPETAQEGREQEGGGVEPEANEVAAQSPAEALDEAFPPPEVFD